MTRMVRFALALTAAAVAVSATVTIAGSVPPLARSKDALLSSASSALAVATGTVTKAFNPNRAAKAIAPPAPSTEVGAQAYHAVTFAINEGASYSTNPTVSLDTTSADAVDMKVTPPFKQVSAGPNHGAAIGSDGTLWTCGSNGSGELGLGYVGGTVYSWTQVGTDTNWKSVSAGNSHTLALKTDGTLWAFGSNGNAQLATSTALPYSGSPLRVAPAISDFTTITAGRYHGMALRSNGSAYSWGYNYNYQCGYTSPNPQPVPTQVGGGRTFTAIGAGLDLSVGMEPGGNVYQWGNINGVNTAAPVQVNLGSNLAQSISVGYSAALVLTRSGTLYGWGTNGNGQLGIGNYTTTWTPTQVAGGASNWKQVATGLFHTSAINTNGEMWVWGDGSYFGLGNGSYMTTSTPMRLGTSTAWSSVSVGDGSNLALQGDVLWGWGSPAGDNIGNFGKATRVPTVIGTEWQPYAQHLPFAVGNFYDTTYTVTMGFRTAGGAETYHATDGIYVDTHAPWGSMSVNGGAAFTTTRSVTINSSVNEVTQMRVDGGAWVPYASTAQATLSAGDGVKTVTVDYKDQAEQTITLSDTITLDTTPPSGTMTLNNGVETTTGVNVRMQLNVSPDTAWMSVNSPGWKQISSGGGHVLGIKNDGTLWAWGFNGNGELGIGNNTDKSVPTQVGTASDWVVVSAGQNISAGIRAGGTLWTWGAGGSYALGTGNTTSRNTPGADRDELLVEDRRGRQQLHARDPLERRAVGLGLRRLRAAR